MARFTAFKPRRANAPQGILAPQPSEIGAPQAPRVQQQAPLTPFTGEPISPVAPINGMPPIGGLQPPLVPGMQAQQLFNYLQAIPGMQSQEIQTMPGMQSQTQAIPGVPPPGQTQQQLAPQAPFNPSNPVPNFAPGQLANPFSPVPFQTPGLRTPALRKARPNLFGFRR